jgi:hypothetical protein
MSVVLLIVFICISYLVVRIGAIALEMTGMERSRARFQALSAFPQSGYYCSFTVRPVSDRLPPKVGEEVDPKDSRDPQGKAAF